jgi:hypothetical protein
MAMHIPECPVCMVRMEEGYIPNLTQNGYVRSTWIEGEPEKAFIYGLKTKGKRKLDTITFRCPQCGWLVWFAPEKESDNQFG